MRIKVLAAVLALAVAVPCVASSQQSSTISGQVVDATGAPVRNAVASIVDLGIETRTDRNGRFAFGNIPNSEYTLTFRHTGMSSASVSHVRPGAALSNVVLVASPVVIHPVTVTGTRGATEVGSSV